MTGLTLPVAAALAWLLSPFVSGALVARSARALAAVERHLYVCLAAGWLGIAGLVWGATSLDQRVGVAAFLVGGPLGGLSIWSRSSGGHGPGDDPPDEPAPVVPEWDWERFERELGEYETGRLSGARGQP
jgi:hypothetical protein